MLHTTDYLEKDKKFKDRHGSFKQTIHAIYKILQEIASSMEGSWKTSYQNLAE